MAAMLTYRRRLGIVSAALKQASEDASPTDAQGLIRFLISNAWIELHGGHFTDSPLKRAVAAQLKALETTLDAPMAPIGSE